MTESDCIGEFWQDKGYDKHREDCDKELVGPVPGNASDAKWRKYYTKKRLQAAVRTNLYWLYELISKNYPFSSALKSAY